MKVEMVLGSEMNRFFHPTCLTETSESINNGFPHCISCEKLNELENGSSHRNLTVSNDDIWQKQPGRFF